ncbi:ABC transporter ATP-binding protein [Rhodopseudomonas sp. HC1]|uniref:ABC transporter ATP-binding protein n=1 Tax=Rhodopseudomonas infernalis TaxID=2897386 RepID=UPI001EE80794|nr:ABC transporter ATP-binding protein [Rhodopseudomonas infernalis]MCG6205995.1 ABC transporter ATP-binding protein [Rhodopseudomonas infernalis]
MNMQFGTPQSASVLSCKGLSARYHRVTVVSGVDLSLQAGEMLAVLGSNGAGKSSMLQAIAGVVRGGGDIIVNGRNLGGMSAHKRALHGLSLVPEQRRNIFPTMTVRENIDIGLALLPASEREAQRAFIIDLFPILQTRETAMAGMLSGGEQQMLAIGLALGRKPAVLALDEPSQGLAPAVFDILAAAFDRLKKNGLALLLAEQNVPFAARIVDRYVVLSHGHIVSSGDRADLDDPQRIAEAFLGTGRG